MDLPLIDAAEYFLNLKQAAEELLPAVEEHAEEGGLPQALSEAAKSKLGLAIAYRVYSESLRDPSNSAIGEHFKEHSEDCLNDVDFFVRRSSVMSGGASLEGVESPPASGDLTEILQVLSKMEEANLSLMSELVVLLEGNPSKYEVEAMMAKDQHHLDDITQHMPVAPELPSVAEEVPSVQEAAPPAAPPGVIGPAKVAGVSAKSGLSRVGELLSGSRVKKLEGLSDKLQSGKPLGDHATIVDVRRLTRAQKGVEAERNSVRTARAITAVGATGVGAAGAHKLLSKKEAGVSAAKGLDRVKEIFTGSRAKKLMDAADKAQERSERFSGSYSNPLLKHVKRPGADKVRSERAAGRADDLGFGSLKERAKQVGAIGGTAAAATGAVIGAKKLLSKKDSDKEKTSEMGAAAMGQHSPVAPPAPLNGAAAGQHPKLAQRTYDMGGSKRDGKAYSMHTTPDDYELSQLINSKMDGDLRGVRGKAKNEGMLVGSGLGAVKGLKAGKGWGGGEVIRTGGGGGTVIGTFGSGGKMPKGMGADIRENQGMIRDELRGQGIKIGGAWNQAMGKALGDRGITYAGQLASKGLGLGRAVTRLGGAGAVLGAGVGAAGGAVAGGPGHRLSGALGGAAVGGVAGGAAGAAGGAAFHRSMVNTLNKANTVSDPFKHVGPAAAAMGPKLGADKSDSELAETGRQRAVANLASGFTSDKHTSGERHGTLAGRLGGAAVGAGAGALASKGATLPVRLAAGMGGAVIGGSMGGQIGKTIGSDHDAEKFWANHKEATAEGVAEALGRHAGRVSKHTGIHDAITTGAGPLVDAVKKPLMAIKDGVSSGYSDGVDEIKGWKERHTKEAAGIGGALAGMGEKAVAALGKRGITHAGQLGGTLTHAAMGALPGAVIGAAGGAAAGGEGHRLSGALTGGVLGGAAGATAGHVGGRLLRAAPSPSAAPAQLASGKPGTVMAGPLPSAHTAVPQNVSIGSSPTVIPSRAHSIGSSPTVIPSSSSSKMRNLTMEGGEELAAQYRQMPEDLRNVVESTPLVRDHKMQPHNALGLLQSRGSWGPNWKGGTPPRAPNPAHESESAVARVLRQAAETKVGSVSHGTKEMSPVLGKRVMRNAKQVWDKTVKEAMGEEAPVGQYLQEEAAGRQAQEAAESSYLREQLEQTSQQLEQTQAQAQEQEAQVGEMQGTIQQLQGQQAEQAQAADAAVQTARQTAEAAMSQSMQRSAELMKQTQLAAGLQNAAATMKEQLMALSQTPVPPATVGEAGELDAAAQQQVGQDQAMEEQAAMEEEAQMAAAQGAPPAAAPAAPAPPKTAGMISGAGKVLRNAPGGVVGGVVGAASAAGMGALLRHKETAFLTDAVKKLEAKQQGGFLTGMMLAEARMVADRSAVMDQHPGKAALLNAVRGAGAGFALDKTIRHIS